MTFSCGCCLNVYPDLYRHVHHKIPRATGGKDDVANLIELCPGCHDALHKIAYKLLSPKVSSSQIFDLVGIIFKDNARAQKTCLELAQYVRDAIVANRESTMEPNQLVSLGTKIRKIDKDLIMVRCKEMGISQEEYFRYLVLKDLCQLRGDSNATLQELLKFTRHLKKQRTNF